MAKKLINDLNLKKVCNKYGIKDDNVLIYDNYIELISSYGNISILLNKNYDIISVFNNQNESYKKIIKYYENTKFINISSFFQPIIKNYTLKEIIDIGNTIDINYDTHDIIINGEWHNSSNDSKYDKMLIYIKFLAEKIKKFNDSSYQYNILGINYPFICHYVRELTNRMDECVEYFIENNKKVTPINILTSIGCVNELEEYNLMLHDVIDLIVSLKGYKWDNGKYCKIKINNLTDEDYKNIKIEIMKVLINSNESVEHNKFQKKLK